MTGRYVTGSSSPENYFYQAAQSRLVGQNWQTFYCSQGRQPNPDYQLIPDKPINQDK